MGYKAKILKDSVNDEGCRLTTMEITFPRIVLAEFNTHRMFSRNAASTRAIPVSKTLERVKNNPFTPIHWGKNQPGMAAEEELCGDELLAAQVAWLAARDAAVASAEALMRVGLHKQLAGRILEPFQFTTVVVSSTTFENFFMLRCHKDAQPEIRKIAEMMQALYVSNVPTVLKPGGWHVPMADDFNDLLANGYDVPEILRIASARIARISYETHDGKRDPSADLVLSERLVTSKHWSPLEHIAQNQSDALQYRNFRGWKQLRQFTDGDA